MAGIVVTNEVDAGATTAVVSVGAIGDGVDRVDGVVDGTAVCAIDEKPIITTRVAAGCITPGDGEAVRRSVESITRVIVG